MDKSCAFVPHALPHGYLKATPESPIVVVSSHICFPLCVPTFIGFLVSETSAFWRQAKMGSWTQRLVNLSDGVISAAQVNQRFAVLP